jgi:lysophospholipase L1-like esterase
MGSTSSIPPAPFGKFIQYLLNDQIIATIDGLNGDCLGGPCNRTRTIIDGNMVERRNTNERRPGQDIAWLSASFMTNEVQQFMARQNALPLAQRGIRNRLNARLDRGETFDLIVILAGTNDMMMHCEDGRGQFLYNVEAEIHLITERIMQTRSKVML